MDNSGPQLHVKAMLENAGKLIEMMKTGKGMGWSKEQEEKYKEAYAKSGHEAKVKEAEEQISKLAEMTANLGK